MVDRMHSLTDVLDSPVSNEKIQFKKDDKTNDNFTERVLLS